MLHHEESPEKPQYNMATPPPISRQTPPPILPNPPFSSKNFQTPPFPSLLKKSTPPFIKVDPRPPFIHSPNYVLALLNAFDLSSSYFHNFSVIYIYNWAINFFE